MGFARYLTAGAMAVAVTLGLLLLMHVLIQTNIQGPGQSKEYKVPDIVMPDREIETEFDTSKPEKPEEPDQPPPDIPEPEFDTPEMTSEAIKIKPAFDGDLSISGPGGFGDGDMIPLTVVQPDYPRRAAQKGTEGFCQIKFTVTASGATANPEVDDCPDSVFESASIKATSRLKFKPRVVDGVAVDVPGVAYKFTFKMAAEK